MNSFPIRYNISVSGEARNAFDVSDLMRCIRNAIDDYISNGEMTCNTVGTAVNCYGEKFWNSKKSFYIAPLTSLHLEDDV